MWRCEEHVFILLSITAIFDFNAQPLKYSGQIFAKSHIFKWNAILFGFQPVGPLIHRLEVDWQKQQRMV